MPDRRLIKLRKRSQLPADFPQRDVSGFIVTRFVHPDRLPDRHTQAEVVAAAAVVIARHTGSRDVRVVVHGGRNGVRPVEIDVSKSPFAGVAAAAAEQLDSADAAEFSVVLAFDDRLSETDAHQPLAVSVEDERLTATYDAARYSVAGVQRILRHMQCALTHDRGSTAPASRLPLPVESPVWVPSASSPADPVSCLEQAAQDHPQRRVVADGTSVLDNDRLLAAVAACARELCSPRFEAARVGVLMDHGLQGAVAVLAALWTGRTFVPLDAAEPDSRLARIAADVDLAAVLYPPALKPRAERMSKGRELIEVDIASPAGAPPSPVQPDPDLPAYVLHVSGKTGRPAGVVQTRRGMVQHAHNYGAGVELGPNDVIACLASPGSSAFVTSLLAVVRSGAALEVLDPRQPVEILRSALEERAVSVLHATPTVVRRILEGLDEPDSCLAGVRSVVLAGERVGPEDVRLVRTVMPGAVVINSYGTAECVVALQHRIGDGDEDAAAIPIGSPVPGVGVELFDADGEATEIFGEIVLTGDAVARGYWNRDDPAFAVSGVGEDGARTFRTGDLAWRRPDGALVPVGRNDRQLSLEGHRVEPEEIEARLRSHPAVAQAVVSGEASDPSAVVAYVTTAVASAADATELMRYLERQLPEWSLPSRTAVVDVLPIGPDGEPDFALLREEPPGQPPSDDPVTEAERAVAEIWSKVLRRTDLGVNQHFVRLGGDSLQLVRMIALVKERFESKLEIRDVLREPTIRGIGRLIDGQAAPEGDR